MQNKLPADSDIPDLPDLPELPKRVRASTVILLVMFIGLLALNIYNQNWLGAVIDSILAVAVLVFAYLHYRKINELRRSYRVLKCMRTMLQTPVMREEANSIIFTFLFPSPEIMKEITKLHSQQKAKEE